MTKRYLLAAAAALAIATPAAAEAAISLDFNYSFKLTRVSVPNRERDESEFYTGSGVFTADFVLPAPTGLVFKITGASGTIVPSFDSDPATYTVNGVDDFGGEQQNYLLLNGDTITYKSIGLAFEGGPSFFDLNFTTGEAGSGEALYAIDSFQITLPPAAASPAPEPATWGMMMLGFGVVGGALRRRRDVVSVTA